VFINQLRKQETGLVRKPKWTGTVTKYRLIWYFTNNWLPNCFLRWFEWWFRES
jgi:hypothetical protein